MNKITQKFDSTKKFVIKHKTALAVSATALAGLALHVRVVNGYNDFLDENNLREKFNAPAEEN